MPSTTNKLRTRADCGYVLLRQLERYVFTQTANLTRLCGKTQSEHRLALGGGCIDLDLVIATRSGEPIRPSTTSGRFRTVVGACGLAGIRFHDLRHAHATILLKAGTPPHVVSTRLGRSTVAFTLQVYAHVLPGQQHEAADAIEAALLG